MIDIISINNTVESERLFFCTLYAIVWTIRLTQIASLRKYFTHNKVVGNQYIAIFKRDKVLNLWLFVPDKIHALLQMYKKYAKITRNYLLTAQNYIWPRRYEAFEISNCKYLHKRLIKALTHPKKLEKSQNCSLFI